MCDYRGIYVLNTKPAAALATAKYTATKSAFSTELSLQLFELTNLPQGEPHNPVNSILVLQWGCRLAEYREPYGYQWLMAATAF